MSANGLFAARRDLFTRLDLVFMFEREIVLERQRKEPPPGKPGRQHSRFGRIFDLRI